MQGFLAPLNQLALERSFSLCQIARDRILLHLHLLGHLLLRQLFSVIQLQQPLEFRFKLGDRLDKNSIYLVKLRSLFCRNQLCQGEFSVKLG